MAIQGHRPGRGADGPGRVYGRNEDLFTPGDLLHDPRQGQHTPLGTAETQAKSCTDEGSR